MMTMKNYDNKGRWRSRTVGFRVSEEEWDLFCRMVKLSGLTRQEYIMKKLSNFDVVVMGNSRIYKALKDEMGKILEQLERINSLSGENDELMILIKQISDILKGFKGDEGNG